MFEHQSTVDGHRRPLFTGVPPSVPHGWLTIDARTYLDVSAKAPPRIIFDGREVLGTSWGRSSYRIEAGSHTVHCGRRTIQGLEKSTVTIQVDPGQHVHLEYRGPLSRGFDGALGPSPQKPPGLTGVVCGAVGVMVLLLATAVGIMLSA